MSGAAGLFFLNKNIWVNANKVFVTLKKVGCALKIFIIPSLMAALHCLNFRCVYCVYSPRCEFLTFVCNEKRFPNISREHVRERPCNTSKLYYLFQRNVTLDKTS